MQLYYLQYSQYCDAQNNDCNLVLYSFSQAMKPLWVSCSNLIFNIILRYCYHGYYQWYIFVTTWYYFSLLLSILITIIILILFFVIVIMITTNDVYIYICIYIYICNTFCRRRSHPGSYAALLFSRQLQNRLHFFSREYSSATFLCKYIAYFWA
jgi:hypothetical protein